MLAVNGSCAVNGALYVAVSELVSTALKLITPPPVPLPVISHVMVCDPALPLAVSVALLEASTTTLPMPNPLHVGLAAPRRVSLGRRPERAGTPPRTYDGLAPDAVMLEHDTVTVPT